MDSTDADFEKSLISLRNRLKINALPIQYPIFNKEGKFAGIIDIINLKGYLYDGKIEEITQEIAIPDEMREKINSLRTSLIENLCLEDPLLSEKFLEEKEISVQEIKTTLRNSVLHKKIFPVSCGSALKNIGVKYLLDNIIDYLPSPLDVGVVYGVSSINEQNVKVSRKCSENEPFCALVFKVVKDNYGKLYFLRIYSGTLVLSSGTCYVFNSTIEKRESINRLKIIHADKRKDVFVAKAGDIVAAVGLKESFTGHTLCSENQPIVLEEIDFSEPMVSQALEVESKSDEYKLDVCLSELSLEDPTFKTEYNKETKQTTISGMGILHLEYIV